MTCCGPWRVTEESCLPVSPQMFSNCPPPLPFCDILCLNHFILNKSTSQELSSNVLFFSKSSERFVTYKDVTASYMVRYCLNLDQVVHISQGKENRSQSWTFWIIFFISTTDRLRIIWRLVIEQSACWIITQRLKIPPTYTSIKSSCHHCEAARQTASWIKHTEVIFQTSGTFFLIPYFRLGTLVAQEEPWVM